MPDFVTIPDDLIAFTQDLIRRPSVLGHEQAVADCVAERMRDLQYQRVSIDSAGNVIGSIDGAAGGPTILFDAHMDTVDVVPRDAWARDPFGGELVDGRIHGRGTSDMKGALAAMVYAVAGLDRDKLRGTAVVCASVGEELIEGAALGVVMDQVKPDFVVIGEASALNLVRAGRGRAEFKLHGRGKPAHASTPADGINAVHTMMRVIQQIERIEMPHHPFVGHGVMCLTDIISDPHPAHSVVPSGCKVTYERRLIPGDTQESLMASLRGACEAAGAPETDIDLARIEYETYTGVVWDKPKWLAPWELPEEHALVRGAVSALRRAGLSPELTSYQFCTNAAHSAGVEGVPTIGFGPSSERLAHVIDEYVEVDQLTSACRGYAAIATTMLAAE